MAALAYQPETYITLDEYVEIERTTGLKHEWFNGQVWAMAGAAPVHNTIATNLNGTLYNQLRGQPCQAWGSDQKIKVPATGLYAYPDVIVAWPPHQWDEEAPNTLLNPSVIIEILSPSTEGYDRNAKFDHYRRLESLTDYVLVASDRRKIEHFHRREDGDWLLHIAEVESDAVTLSGINCRLDVREVYERVEFAPTPPGVQQQFGDDHRNGRAAPSPADEQV